MYEMVKEYNFSLREEKVKIYRIVTTILKKNCCQSYRSGVFKFSVLRSYRA